MCTHNYPTAQMQYLDTSCESQSSTTIAWVSRIRSSRKGVPAISKNCLIARHFTKLCQMGSPIIISWTSDGCLVVFATLVQISIESLCKKTARTLISPRVQWRLIYVCTVFHVPQIDGHAYMGLVSHIHCRSVYPQRQTIFWQWIKYKAFRKWFQN